MRIEIGRGVAYGPHEHREAQLIFAGSGTMHVHTDDGRWLVPPQLAVWAPAQVAHGMEALTDMAFRSVYFAPEACGMPGLERPFVLRMTPLLRALVQGLFTVAAESERAGLMARLILHELREVPVAPTFLPMPAEGVGQRVAQLALADHACRMGLADLAVAGASSTRTISRVFAEQVGMSFKAWRQRARIVAAMDRLVAGASISQASAHAGFASTAAFAFSFRQVTGETVGDFLAGGRQGEETLARVARPLSESAGQSAGDHGELVHRKPG